MTCPSSSRPLDECSGRIPSSHLLTPELRSRLNRAGIVDAEHYLRKVEQILLEHIEHRPLRIWRSLRNDPVGVESLVADHVMECADRFGLALAHLMSCLQLRPTGNRTLCSNPQGDERAPDENPEPIRSALRRTVIQVRRNHSRRRT